MKRLRPVVVLALLASSAPGQAPAQEPDRCATPSGARVLAQSSDAVVFGRPSGRVGFCVRHDGTRGTLVAARRIALAGPYAVHLRDEGPRDALVLRDLATGEETVLATARDGALRGHAVDDRGRAVWALGRRVLAREPSGRVRTLQRAGARATGLRLSGGVARWRSAGRPRSAALADATCAPSFGARAIAETPDLVVLRRVDEEGSREDLVSFRRTVLTWGCVRTDGRRRLVASGGSGFGYGSGIGEVAVAGTLVGFVRSNGTKYGEFSARIEVFDAATGTLVRRGVEVDEPLALVALDAAARAAALEVVPGRPDRLHALDAAGRQQVLDEAPRGTITEVALAPGTISWRREGEPRSASLP